MSDWENISDNEWNEYFEEKMQSLLETLNSTEILKLNEDLQFLSNALSTNDNDQKQQRLLKQTFIGRTWLKDEIEKWLNGPANDPFMIFGVPGAGKSAFIAQLEQFNPQVFASTYFEWDRDETKSAAVVVKRLAFKLATSLPDYRALLCDIYRNENKVGILNNLSGSSLFDEIILTASDLALVLSPRQTTTEYS
jgi:hypothetical protein